MLFSDAFGITRGKGDDWFDAILDNDTKLFVDPFLIFKQTSRRWRGAHDKLISHFDTCFKLIAEGNRNPASIPYQKALALLKFPEPQEFCLGYTERGTRGAGGGMGYARLIAKAMEDAITRGLQDLRHFEELGILNEGIGPDRISDLACNILRADFISYTKQVASRHNLPVSRQRIWGAGYDPRRKAWATESHELPVNPCTNGPLLLLPQRFLRDLPVLNADDWWENYEAEQLRLDANYEVMGHVDKRTIVETARRNVSRVRDWEQQKEQTDPAPYDFSKDRLGVWQWDAATRAYVEANPLTIRPPDSDRAFFEVIDRVIEAYRHYIEEEGGWRLLWNDDKSEKHEEATQLLFKGIAQSYCRANNIVLDREVELGRGPVDFKFSNGYQHRAHLEVKKLHNGRFWHGLQAQLPAYLSSDNCPDGWYLAVRYKATGTSTTWARDLPRILKALSDRHRVSIRLKAVDGMPKPSASRA